MKRKELFLMFVPCLLLLGAGAYFSRHGAQNADTFSVTLDEVKVLPLTPYDIAKGHDAKVLVKTKMHGVPHELPGSVGSTTIFELHKELVSLKTNRIIEIPNGTMGIGSISHTNQDGQHETTLLISLKNVAPTAQPIALRVFAKARLVEAGINPEKILQSSATNAQLVTIRPANVTAPPFNKYRPFEIIGCRTSWQAVTGGQICELHIITKRSEAPINGEGRSEVNWSGQLWGDGNNLNMDGSMGYGYDEKTQITEIVPSVRSIVISKNLRTVVLKGALSLNDCWPLPIEIVLRENGKNIALPGNKFVENKIERESSAVSGQRTNAAK